MLAPAQADEVLAYRESLNPARLARGIAMLQQRLIVFAKAKAKAKTEQLYLDTIPTALPDLRKGIHVAAS